MVNINKVCEIVNDFDFRKGDYLGAEEQLLKFAENYVKLSAEEADFLRSNFDPKDRFAWFRVASVLFSKNFSSADNFQRDRLCNIFFALYSFDNLEFGFDSVIDVSSVSNQMKNHMDIVRKNWSEFSRLTSNDSARNNLENKLFT